MVHSTQGSSQSTDYFDDDPEFVKAISELPLPGDDLASREAQPPLEQRPKLCQDELQHSNPSLKRARSSENAFEGDSDDGAWYHASLNAVDSRKDGVDEDGDSYLDGHTYGASRFGEFGEYMTRKRAKLQVQNAEIEPEEDDGASASKLFSGLQIYVRVFSASDSPRNMLMFHPNR